MTFSRKCRRWGWEVFSPPLKRGQNVITRQKGKARVQTHTHARVRAAGVTLCPLTYELIAVDMFAVKLLQRFLLLSRYAGDSQTRARHDETELKWIVKAEISSWMG